MKFWGAVIAVVLVGCGASQPVVAPECEGRRPTCDGDAIPVCSGSAFQEVLLDAGTCGGGFLREGVECTTSAPVCASGAAPICLHVRTWSAAECAELVTDCRATGATRRCAADVADDGSPSGTVTAADGV